MAGESAYLWAQCRRSWCRHCMSQNHFSVLSHCEVKNTRGHYGTWTSRASINLNIMINTADSARPIDYSVSDSRVEFPPAPIPCSRSSLLHAHRSMGFFHNQTFVLPETDSPRPIDYSVTENRVEFTPVPTPWSWPSLLHAHRSMVFFRNQTFALTAADSVRPID